MYHHPRALQPNLKYLGLYFCSKSSVQWDGTLTFASLVFGSIMSSHDRKTCLIFKWPVPSGIELEDFCLRKKQMQ